MSRLLIVIIIFILLTGLFIYLNPDILTQLTESLENAQQGGGGNFTPYNSTNISFNTTFNATNGSEITICSWNVQILGDTKASKTEVMEKYQEVLVMCDIMVIQEIRDKDQSAWVDFYEMFPTYSQTISHRAGRSISKEQYGILYKGVELVNTTDLWNQTDKWERPPYIMDFKLNNWSFTLVTIHTKPTDVPNELDNLEDAVEDLEGDIMVLGDLNTGGVYYTLPHTHFEEWEWRPYDYEDTTVSSVTAAYDRFIMNDGFFERFAHYGIYKDVEEEVSDHYMIHASFYT